MPKHIVKPVPSPKRTCRFCGQGGQTLFRKCPRCSRRYLGRRTFGAVH